MKYLKRGMLILLCIFWFTSGNVKAEERDKWSIYLYLCGSDLERVLGAATMDIRQMISVALPEGVNLIIEAGGTKKWRNHYFSPNHIERYIYDKDGFRRLQQLEQANMGDPETLREFLAYCEENYPAEREGVIVWNHGGGIRNGACFDENYNMDSISLVELQELLENSDQEELYDLVGFDACMMGSLETSFILQHTAKYLVASEDTETGYGWSYDTWLEKLAQNPLMNARQLAIEICNSYKSHNQSMGVGERVSMSIVDLNRVKRLQELYELLGWEMLRLQIEDPGFFGELDRHAHTLYRFGSGSDYDEKYEYIDLMKLIEPFVDRLGDTGRKFYDSLLRSCVYNISGEYSEGKSISVYFPLDGNMDMLMEYEKMNCSYSMAAFYRYCLTGELSDTARDYLGLDVGSEQTDVRKTLLDYVSDGFSLDREENAAVTILSAEAMEKLSYVSYSAVYFDENNEQGICLGSDDELECNWETGEIRADLMDWGIEFGGYLGYLGLVYQSKEYNLYDLPIMLNDEPYYLHIVWEEKKQEFEILGVQKKQMDPGRYERKDIQLQPGDRIRMITKVFSDSDDGKMEEVLSDEFIYEEGMKISEREFFGHFAMILILEDQFGERIYSDLLWYDK